MILFQTPPPEKLDFLPMAIAIKGLDDSRVDLGAGERQI